MLKKPFNLGKLNLPSNIFCAPLAGCSDFPFRQMTSAYRPGLLFCEMVKIDAVVRYDPHTFRMLDYDRTMHPIGAQLCGSKLSLVGEAAKIVEELGFDVIDLNCGCPVDKVTKDGSGSGLLKKPELIGEMIAEMVASVKIPVTVKIRAGWDDKTINATKITEIAEKAGAQAICIHGRTREQGYSGNANWDWIKECKQVAKEIKVIGNGDLFSAEKVEKMFAYTGCDAVLLSRGTMGQPWILEDVYEKLSGRDLPLRTYKDYKEAFLKHLEHVFLYQTPRKAILDLRRIGCWYLKKGKGVKKLREEINRSRSVEEVRELIHLFPWEEVDFSE